MGVQVDRKIRRGSDEGASLRRPSALGKHTGHGGTYEYFSCTKRRARNGGTCNSGHYPVARVEAEVAALYWNLKLTRTQIAAIRKAVIAVADKHVGVIKRAAARHRRRLQTLEDEQTKLLQLHFKGGVAESVLQSQTKRIETEQATLGQLLARSEVQLADIAEALDHVLKLTETPPETYLAASNLGRRLLNQVFFTEIRVGEHGEIQDATLTQLARPAGFEPATSRSGGGRSIH